MRRTPSLLWLGSVVLVLALSGSVGVTWVLGWWDPTDPAAAVNEAVLAPTEVGQLERAVALVRKARDAFTPVRDYRCIYLRDELIDQTFTQNVMKLKIRHEPFSVYMEWLDPPSKKGRWAAFVTGKNKNRMTATLMGLKLVLDPQESIRRKESRHTINEAGLKILLDRYEAAWSRLRPNDEVEVTIDTRKLQVKLLGREYAQDCHCVQLRYGEKLRANEFQWVKVYFATDTGLPVRCENHAWPVGSQTEGVLVERYTYLDLETNLGLQDRDFNH